MIGKGDGDMRKKRERKEANQESPKEATQERDEREREISLAPLPNICHKDPGHEKSQPLSFLRTGSHALDRTAS